MGGVADGVRGGDPRARRRRASAPSPGPPARRAGARRGRPPPSPTPGRQVAHPRVVERPSATTGRVRPRRGPARSRRRRGWRTGRRQPAGPRGAREPAPSPWISTATDSTSAGRTAGSAEQHVGRRMRVGAGRVPLEVAAARRPSAHRAPSVSAAGSNVPEHGRPATRRRCRCMRAHRRRPSGPRPAPPGCEAPIQASRTGLPSRAERSAPATGIPAPVSMAAATAAASQPEEPGAPGRRAGHAPAAVRVRARPQPSSPGRTGPPPRTRRAAPPRCRRPDASRSAASASTPSSPWAAGCPAAYLLPSSSSSRTSAVAFSQAAASTPVVRPDRRRAAPARRPDATPPPAPAARAAATRPGDAERVEQHQSQALADRRRRPRPTAARTPTPPGPRGLRASVWLTASQPQVRGAYPVVAGELGTRSGEHRRAALHDVRAVGQVERLRGVLLDEQHGDAAVADRLRSPRAPPRSASATDRWTARRACSSRGRAISARPMASICCWPPLRVSAACRRRSARIGKRSNTSRQRLGHRSLALRSSRPSGGSPRR